MLKMKRKRDVNFFFGGGGTGSDVRISSPWLAIFGETLTTIFLFFSFENEIWILTCFAGQRCEINIDECSSQPCANGGECVDLVDGFKCICPLGYTGAQCQVSLNSSKFFGYFSCLVRERNEILRAGRFVLFLLLFVGPSKSLAASNWRMSCGRESWIMYRFFSLFFLFIFFPIKQTDTDLCHPNPCANGSPCFNTLGQLGGPDYYCLCQSHWQGKNCSRYRQPPPPPPLPASQPSPREFFFLVFFLPFLFFFSIRFDSSCGNTKPPHVPSCLVWERYYRFWRYY